MEDQFGGRTDDDLFADDFEPVPPSAEPAAVVPAPEKNTPSAVPAPQPTAQQTEAPSTSAPPRSLAQSRHNRPAQPRPPRQTSSQPAAAPAASTAAAPPTAPAGPKAAAPAGPKASSGVARLQSGANPRTKLTDDELNAKMEAMRIASAEKSRRFEQAQRDERDHDLVYARGMEEARKRKAADEEKRRRGEEDRRRMEDERAKNRERKLKAMGMKEGGWDEGKHEREEEERRRGGFRGAHGGVRGERATGRSHGFAMERFLAEPESATHLASSDRAAGDVQPEETAVKEFGPNEFRGRARGPRRGTTGRGGRGGRGAHGDRNDRNGGPREDREKPAAKADPPDLTKNDFPALPPGSKPSVETPANHGFQPLPLKKDDAGAKAKAPLAPLSPLSPIQWDEDVAANDAKMAAADAGRS